MGRGLSTAFRTPGCFLGSGRPARASPLRGRPWDRPGVFPELGDRWLGSSLPGVTQRRLTLPRAHPSSIHLLAGCGLVEAPVGDAWPPQLHAGSKTLGSSPRH